MCNICIMDKDNDNKNDNFGYCLGGIVKASEVAASHINKALDDIKSKRAKKINLIWLETSGCFGEIISLLNAQDPDVLYLLNELTNLIFSGTLDGDDGELDYEKIILEAKSEYILVVSGAIPVKSDGLYTVLATYKGRKITSMEAVKMLATNAKYIISVGTCACYGGPSAANPNLSESKGVGEFLSREDIINIPGCPANPLWIMGILGYVISFGSPVLDNKGRPKAYYGELIHDKCERRKYFDLGIFAKKLGDKECMFMLGCKGPSTYAYCPTSRWNGTDNWPIGNNTTCIGCAGVEFPDYKGPFIQYEGE